MLNKDNRAEEGNFREREKSRNKTKVRLCQGGTGVRMEKKNNRKIN